MSRLYLALFWLAGLITLAASIEYQCFVSSLYDANTEHQSASGYHDEKKQDSQSRVVVDPARVTSPDNEGNNGGGENKASSYDLNYRQTVSLEGTLIATWWSVGLSFFSFAGVVIALFITGRQNKVLARANTLAQQTHEAETRPWVSPRICISHRYQPVPDPQGYRVRFLLECINHGSTPAIDVQHTLFGGPTETHRRKAERAIRGNSEKRETPIGGVAIFPGGKHVFDATVDIIREDIDSAGSLLTIKSIIVYGFIEYRSSGSTKCRRTYFLHTAKVTEQFGELVVMENYWVPADSPEGKIVYSAPTIGSAD